MDMKLGLSKGLLKMHMICCLTVGLEPRMEEVISLLNQSEDRVCVLGIYGTGGIGKTTLAKAVYNSIFYHFEGACLLFDVKEASSKYLGIVRLQQKLLSDILEEKVLMSGSADEGISRIKHRLSHKRVLLVLDDVDEVEQLEQLAGGCGWFGCGSKVIITTRNKQLLIACNVEKTYEMMQLNEHDSLELFCQHAFKMNQPPTTFQDMSTSAISYAQGLPLALRVIGSNLAEKNSAEWRCILEQYERIQERTIYEVLKISYDCLQDGAKHIFLDLACFVDKDMLAPIREKVEAYDFGARFYLEVLIEKSLITFIDFDRLPMHDLIRQMGREIVRQEAPLNPEKRSRLWHYQDVLKVLRENLGCNNIEGIMLRPSHREEVKWNGMAFKKMNNLRVLVIRNVQFSTGPRYLPNSLRWLEWEGYPSATLPAYFSPSGLIFLKLPESYFTFKEPFKSFAKYVTEMDFAFCEFITEVPDMSQCQSLRVLCLTSCDNLINVDDSVGYLSRLVRLDFFGCTKLASFPVEMNMPSLEVLSLMDCTSLEYFSHVVVNLDALWQISLQGSAIKELPASLFTSPSLWVLDLGGVHPHTRKPFIKLVQDMQPIIHHDTASRLYLENCGVLDEELGLILSYFQNLEVLHLSRNDFVSLPECIKQCANLSILEIKNCKRLRDIPELPSNLYWIEAANCTSLTAESSDSLYYQAKREFHQLKINMPATTAFPDWFDDCCEGGTLCFRVRGNLIPPIVLAFEVVGKALFLGCITINGHIVIKGKYMNLDFGAGQGNHVLLFEEFVYFTEQEQKEINRYMELDYWNEVEIQITSHSPEVSVVKCGVYVYKKETNMENVKFKSCDASTTKSLKRRAIIASPPSHYEPPNKFMRTDKRKLSHIKKGSRRIKRHQTFHSFNARKMVFPVGKLVWRFLYH